MQVERGIKRSKMGRQCVIFGIESLEWLLSLSKGDWSEICLTDINKAEHCLVVEVLQLLGDRIIEAEGAEDAVKISLDADVLLGAGPGISSSKVPSLLDVSLVILAITAVNQRNRGWSKAWSCSFFTHEQVGGVTEWSGTIVARNWVIPPLQDSVQQNLGHVLEHGDRPSPCSEQIDFPHLSADSLLPLKKARYPM